MPWNKEAVTSSVVKVSSSYEQLVDKFLRSITQLEESLDAYTTFSDLTKTHQDFQKQLIDRLSTLNGIIDVHIHGFNLIY